MPKRTLGMMAEVPGTQTERVHRKSERSHEENQERAYIAASRRTDRSIEARVQSARMASEIHKKRTGKGFKVSEEIVIKEEMYEEEDDDMPRHYRALAANFSINSAEFQSRMQAYLVTNVAMRSMAAREAQIHKEFAEMFPGASSGVGLSMYSQPFQQPQQQGQHQQASPISPTFPHSTSTFSDPRRQSIQSVAQSQDMSPSSPSAVAYSPRIKPSPNSPAFPYATTSASVPMSASMGQTAETSDDYPFTTELPNEVKQLANIDFTDPLAGNFFGKALTGSSNMGNTPWMNYMQPLSTGADNSTIPAHDYQTLQQADSYFSPDSTHSKQAADDAGDRGAVETPNGGTGVSWNDWINDAQYEVEDAEADH